MSTFDLTAILTTIYDAGTSASHWTEVRSQLAELVAFDSVSLRMPQSDGPSQDLLQPERPTFQFTTFTTSIRRDPLREALNRRAAQSNWQETVATLPELMPTERYSRSEICREFARPGEENHFLFGAIGDERGTVLSLFRSTGPFDESDKSIVALLLPHLRRAIGMQHRLAFARHAADVGNAAFDALPGGAVVVDNDLRVHSANATARRMVGEADSPFTFVSRRPPFQQQQTANWVMKLRNANAKLRALVADIAAGGSGELFGLKALLYRNTRFIFQSAFPPQKYGLNALANISWH